MQENNYSTTVEEILYNVPKLKVEEGNLRLDLEETNKIIGITGVSSNEKTGSSTNAFSSMVESEVIDRERNLEKRIQTINVAIQIKERQLKGIENILSILTEKEMLIVKLRYFKADSINRVYDLLDITAITFNKRRKNAIKSKLIPLLFNEKVAKST